MAAQKGELVARFVKRMRIMSFAILRTSDPYAVYATTSTLKRHSNVLHGRGWTRPTRHMHLTF